MSQLVKPGYELEGWFHPVTKWTAALDKDGQPIVDGKGEAIMAPTIEWTEFDFANDTVTSDLTLKAQWRKSQYTVHFDSDGASFPDGSKPKDQTVEANGHATDPQA
jgi:hypothetical protein